jgi:nicotinate dehydrogenase subunit A
MAISKTVNVNGERITTAVDDPKMPLLYLLRGNLGLHGPRFGCGLAQCGACTVHVDGIREARVATNAQHAEF